MHDLELLIDSGRKLIVLETEREGCFIEGFKRLSNRSNKAYFQWTVTQGLLRLADGYTAQAANRDVNQLFGQIQTTELSSVYVLVDFHHYLKEPVAIRHIKDVIMNCPQHSLILLSQSVELPDELQSLATYYKLPLPTVSELKMLVNDLASDWMSESNRKLKVVDKGVVNQLIKSLCGLSRLDAERMARHAIWTDGLIDETDIAEVAKRKFELLNKNNVLNLELDFEELGDIAGFDYLKSWLEVRRDIFSGKVALPGGDIPKGLLLLGMQGCGKSMAAKAVAGSWQLPLLHLDFGTLYNRWHGQTEENLRAALNTADKMEPCVLWLDEVEKGLSAVSSSDDTSKRLLGTFLTWLAEKKTSVFVVATANDVSALPPELMRKGRFDEVFFVDLPAMEDRNAIFRIHMARRELEPNTFDLDELASLTDGFSGAEIEQLIVSAVYQQHAHKTQVDTKMLIELIGTTKPLSVLMQEKMLQLRHWAQGRAVSVS